MKVIFEMGRYKELENSNLTTETNTPETSKMVNYSVKVR